MDRLGGANQDMDMMKWMGLAALEVIGRAGMDHSFVSFSSGDAPVGEVGEAVKNFVSVDYLRVPSHSEVHPCDQRPSIFALTGLRLGADTIEKLTTARFRRWVAPKIPSRRFQAAKRCVEILHDSARSIFATTKASSENNGQASSEQKVDIMSILRMSRVFLF